MLDVQTVGLAPAFIPYPDAWARQREIHADVVSGTRPDTLLLLEHEPVFTAEIGRASCRERVYVLV